MTLAFMHYGPIRALVNFNEFMREYNEVRKQNDKAQADALRTANVRYIYIHHNMLRLLTAIKKDASRCHERLCC